MNKTKIKNFSVWARKNLMQSVSYGMRILGIDENGIAEELSISSQTCKYYDMRTSQPVKVSGADIARRDRLCAKIQKYQQNSDYLTAYEATVEEIAYTWFNRLIAIRFMEVNGYLPSGIRVLSSENGKQEPDIVTYAVEVAESEGFSITSEEIWKLKDENKPDELFFILFTEQCRKLGEILPELFGRFPEETDLFVPLSFVSKDGLIYHLVNDIDETDFNVTQGGQIEIIGWMYQYYNTEPKDKIFSRSSKTKMKKEEIPIATQLFTPDWIVRYMVENSLGRFWTDGNPDTPIKSGWKYYLDEVQQTAEVKEKFDTIQTARKNISPEKIRFIDPCTGSGHILVYAFDMLMQIYLSCGYTERDAVQKIIRYNLWGLDLDKRAYQIAYFCLMMKGKQYDRRFLTRNISPNLSHFQELSIPENIALPEKLQSFVKLFENADTYGSLLDVPFLDVSAILQSIPENSGIYAEQIQHMAKLYDILSQKYDIVCTNPPYMGNSGMNSILSDFVREHYKAGKADLFSCFIEKCRFLTKENGYYSMITMHSWMFLLSFVDLRREMLNDTIINLLHLGACAFEQTDVGTIVQTTAFVSLKAQIPEHHAIYVKLNHIMDYSKKSESFFDRNNDYIACQSDFMQVKNFPVAYWASPAVLKLFECQKLEEISRPRQGMSTSDNRRFLRKWYEIPFGEICFTAHNAQEAIASRKKWFPYNKGGGFRKWFGNYEYVVNYYNDGEEMQAFHEELNKTNSGGRIKNKKYYFRESVTWTFIAIMPAFRYCPEGFLFDVAGSSMFLESDNLKYMLGLLCSKQTAYLLDVLNPTMNIQTNDIKSLPYLDAESQKPEIERIVQENIELSREDWDSFEMSWNFRKHPFVRGVDSVEEAFQQWAQECENRFGMLKANEEELNRIFIEIYGLQDELNPEESEKEITVRKADLQRDMRNFVSYAVGCMLGRYSLDVDGLAYAGGAWDNGKYQTFPPVDCLTVTEEPFFENDIVTQFVKFISVVFRPERTEENLQFIADGLGTRYTGTAREKLRLYFMKDFFKNHCKTYQKRPIYWMFDSGKKNGFKALCYVHRWTIDTMGNIRTDYLHPLQQHYRDEITHLQADIDSGEEVVKNQKRLEKIMNQLRETEEYDSQMGMVISARTALNPDDGIRENHEKAQIGIDGINYPILAKI